MLLSTAHDVTEHRRAQELEQQLHESQKFEALGRLAGGVAHDFNNMLTAILGYSDFAIDDLTDEQEALREKLVEVRRAADRAAQLTQQLLLFSRRQLLKREPVNVNQLVTEYGAMLVRLIGEDILLELELAAGELWVSGDKGQLGQVILNLCVNARDAMPGGGSLAIRTSELAAADGRYLRMAISDTGGGIDDATLPHVFEPFFTTKGVGVGTGLGLATVHSIIDDLGGSIDVQTSAGGTAFTITLPATDPPAAPAAAPVRDLRRDCDETILLVEDEDAVRRLVQRMLAKQGYRLVVAESPQAALEIVAAGETTVGLVLTDVVMPQMNGRQLVERIRELVPDVKALFMSGYTDDAMVARGVLSGEMPFIQKPFTPSQLTDALATALARPAPTAAADVH